MPTESPSGFYNIRAFGAKGDRSANDATAIQAAIDACAGAGGGTVRFPAGDYLSGAIVLRSHVTLELMAGATLWASTDPHDYPDARGKHLISAEDAEHIALVGQGCLHGQGEADLPWAQAKNLPFRIGVLLFEHCRHVTIRDVTILFSDAWTVHLRRCQTVFIDGVTIFNNVQHINSDGIDPNSCRDVHISNCHIVAGDDCIVLKSTGSEPCENIVITNCTVETTCAALKLGTESHGDFRNIHFANCTIRNSFVGIGFYLKDGASMEQVTFSGISIECNPVRGNQAFPIFMDIEKRHEDSRIGAIRDVAFRDVYIKSGSGILIQGMPESLIENLTLSNITLRAEHADDYTNRRKPAGGTRTVKDERDTLYAQEPAWCTIAYVDGLTVRDLHVHVSEEAAGQSPRETLSLHHVANASVDDEPAQ
ncbi:MAG: right-handed parallel beta-helix repeat-containing protein [Kiritimatiellae bacterium]|nr:right-handed parallel beta-helix repeat-containing protein [Kiritimatiellia bacterium]